MNKLLTVLLFIGIHGVFQSSARIPVHEFYPFGQEHGDMVVPTADDNFVEHVLQHGPMHFVGQSYTNVFVNNNGGISFGQGVSAFTPTCGPQNIPMVIPFWADVDTRNGGFVYYRESQDPQVLAQATSETVAAFPGLASTLNIDRVFIITWSDVAFFGSANCGPDSQAKRNNFQAVIATDGTQSFIIFNYDSVNWVTGTASGGNCDGRGGTPAKAGFDFGDGVKFFSLPGSCSEEISDVTETSNIQVNGKWIFRVDLEEVEDPAEAEPMPEPIPDPEPEIPEDGECDPNDCNLQGYCYHYAQCQHDTRQYRVFECSHGLYWNPHNVSALHPYAAVPVMSAGRRRRDLTEDGFHPHQQDEEQCHGSCDIWDNLPAEIQHIYLHDEQCFPKCSYGAIAECENRYMFHPHNTDARVAEIVHCPVDHSTGIPLVWVQERESCDFCYNAFRSPDGNGTVHPCCEHSSNGDHTATPPHEGEHHWEESSAAPAEEGHQWEEVTEHGVAPAEADHPSWGGMPGEENYEEPNHHEQTPGGAEPTQYELDHAWMNAPAAAGRALIKPVARSPAHLTKNIKAPQMFDVKRKM